MTPLLPPLRAVPGAGAGPLREHVGLDGAIGVAVRDPGAVSDLADDVHADLERSTEYDITRRQQRSRTRRAPGSAFGLLGPSL